MICHECSSYRQRESLPFKRKICIYVSLSSFAFGLIGLQVWFWYPEQCRAQMLHLLFSPSLAGCSYCSCLTFWICVLSACVPSWQHGLRQQPGSPIGASVWVPPTKEGLAFELMPGGPEERKMDLFCQRKELLGCLSSERKRERKGKRWKSGVLLVLHVE